MFRGSGGFKASEAWGARKVQRPEFMCFLVLRSRAYGYLPLRPIKHDVQYYVGFMLSHT